MRELTFVQTKTISIREEMIQHIHAINKYLTPEYLEGLETKILMNEVHPAYRDYFADKLKKELKETTKID